MWSSIMIIVVLLDCSIDYEASSIYVTGVRCKFTHMLVREKLLFGGGRFVYRHASGN